MRGSDRQQGRMWSYVSLEERVPDDHPLRTIRDLVNEVLKELSPKFQRLYARTGRPSIPPERLLRALLLQALYSIRSERMLMEQLEYNLLFRWFVGLGMDDPVWNPTTFTKNRDRLLRGDLAREFFQAVVGLADRQGWVSDEHFTVDGTLIEGWAGQKSFKKKGKAVSDDEPDDPGNPTVDFHGEKRSNKTHQSTTDPEVRLYKKTKGAEAKLCYQGHVLMENRHGLAVNAQVTLAGGCAEREAALGMVEELPGSHPVTVGADKGYDTQVFVAGLRERKAIAHVARNESGRKSAIDGRTTRHDGYGLSQRRRKRVEEIFGWLKTIGMMRKTRHRGRTKVDWMFTFVVAAYNLVRMRTLVEAVT